ncbi:PREDICTED: uncharacterized protein LOC105121369 [Populus euphratica]|uniref:Uncharacterized protein LOC105121369 n=1 Tax=Populus euphratica TaxID=75702 RepID=A0AAJ6TVH6_POPEU|nr:PREDICTED: uncharacterized protein LOC105121369 [Populus euphratica]XP_011018271.1 PREDICTED: uncharacterized protein LOC105121369 [Populus euphratica]
MPSPFSIFSRSNTTKQTPIPFKDYYTKWFNTLKNTLLPLLHHSLSSSPSSPTLLSSHLHLILHHLLSYYESLDLAATTNTKNLPHLLYPSWRNPLETPFLFLGDLHPYVFTNLLRSFLDEADSDEDTENNLKVLVFDRPCQVVMAWKDPSKHLMIKIEQIERGLRLMVPALLDRVKKAQSGFAGKIAEEWVNSERKEKMDFSEAMKAEMEELVTVFLHANRLRRSVISEIVAALNVYQGALFLEGLAQFLVGFQDKNLLREFERCKTPISERVGH